MSPSLNSLLPGSRTKLFLFALVFFFFAGGLCLLFLRPSGPERPISFQLRKGLSGQEVARDLKDSGLLSHRATFLIWVKLFGSQRIQPGIYEFSTRQSGLSIYRQVIKGPPLVRITFPEGWMAKQMADLLEMKGICKASEFLEIVTKEKLEGYLFPDTYLLPQESSPRRVVDRLKARYAEIEPKDFEERAKALGMKKEQLVIMASLVEKEARVSQERGLIAGVFYNRLKKRMYLESCATVEYALGKWKPRLLYKDLEIKSPYNTYRNAGLPPGPICNPGLASLEAAAHPETTEMLFFVADGQGTHRFSRYYKDHLNAKKKR